LHQIVIFFQSLREKH